MALEENGATANLDENEVIEVTPEVVEPKSMEDTIRETLRGLQDKGATLDTSESLPDTPEEKAQAIRDKQGKFAAKETAPIAPDTPLIPVEPTGSISAAPNTWKKEAQEAWIKADPTIRAEVERRESDFHRGIEQYKVAANYGQTMERAMQPFAATLQSLGLAPEKAISELMAADHKLRYGSAEQKNAYFAQLAQSYGIDLANVQAPEQQYIDPNMSAMQQRVQQLEGHIQHQSLMGQQQEQNALTAEVNRFSQGKEYIDQVGDEMLALLPQIVTLNPGLSHQEKLQKAYDMAIFANPITRAAVLAKQQTEARAEATKKAQLAKGAASVNTRSRPSMPVSQPIGTMDETIRATLRRLQSA